MAENSESFCREIARFIENRIRVPTRYVNGVSWPERERLFDAGKIDILWFCGLPYVEKADMADGAMELLAVPIPRGARYRGKPVYFSDVVVRSEAPFKTFLDLRGRSWAYNEPRSHSGFNVVRAHLADYGYLDHFFGAVLESGSHSASLDMVLAGRVDGTAIDTTVLERLIDQCPALDERIRVIETFGPSPIPPWVISQRVPASLRSDIRHLFLTMHIEAFGRVMLDHARIDRFVVADDSDYDPIRVMARKAARVLLD